MEAFFNKTFDFKLFKNSTRNSIVDATVDCCKRNPKLEIQSTSPDEVSIGTSNGTSKQKARHQTCYTC